MGDFGYLGGGGLFYIQKMLSRDSCSEAVVLSNRVDTVNVTGQYQYRSPNSFVREPFVVRFQSQNTSQCTRNVQGLLTLF